MRYLLFIGVLSFCAGAEFQPVTIQPVSVSVQPMTGIVLWSDNEQVATDAIQLEYSYVRYDAVATGPDVEKWDWTPIEKLLAAAAARKHQQILRLHFVYPGEKSSAVPAYIKALPGYRDVVADSEKQPTGFCDWGHAALQDFAIDFNKRMAARYDNDPRLAFMQVGFGLWAEYHIYDGPFTLGKTFPDFAYQKRFLQAMATIWQQTPWMISIDAANNEVTPIAGDRSLLGLPFGVFDDSFLCKQHAKENAKNWTMLSGDRWQRAPAGGEFSYYNNKDQKLALSAAGPNGEPFALAAARFHLSFIIGNDQAKHAGLETVKKAGQAIGYKFRIASAEQNDQVTNLSITNDGIAPCYMDVYPAIGKLCSTTSLKGLLPGQTRTCSISARGGAVHMVCARLVPGQVIGFNVSAFAQK